MADTYEYATRPGKPGLSVIAFTGLGALAALLWQLVPGYVILLLIPALAICLWQLTRVPTYGIKMSDQSWHILGGYDDLEVPISRISHLQIRERGTLQRISVMIDDGTEIQLPIDNLPDHAGLKREAEQRGIPVRHAA
ncbi:hypothetical protein V8J82_17915 [Gymnodinialimonas sp. 2305UL16-5]|uniref:hypothetical protein n=1 Tax=Gymnodinialimonas mytili TaxID=3126503 RepID=UPI0030AD2522